MPSNLKRPRAYIIAGANGAGKTTFATEFLPHYAKCRHFVNADLIAKGLSPFRPEKAAIKAGRMMLEELRELSEKGETFAFESTLSGLAYIAFISRLKQRGYEVHIVYLWVPSPSLCIARIKERVALGGHYIPSVQVRRRYQKSLRNFMTRYKTLADEWQILDNTKAGCELIAEGTSSKCRIINQKLYDTLSAV